MNAPTAANCSKMELKGTIIFYRQNAPENARNASQLTVIEQLAHSISLIL